MKRARDIIMNWFEQKALLAVLFCTAAGMLPFAAQAQLRAASSVQEINGTEGQTNWNVVTTDKGCIAYLMGAFFNDQKSIIWSGNCQQGQPITGNGTLTLLFDENARVSWTGQFTSGFLNGRIKFHSTMNGGATETYAMGCVANWGSRCTSTRPSQAKDTTAPAAASAANRAAPPSAPGALSQKQIATCSEDIRRTQLESQSWAGDANAVAARLGRFQKDLFEGRCAGHPEAQAYIAGANKMLGYGGNATGGGSSTSVEHQGNIEIQSAPQCAKYYIVSETPETRTSLKKFSFGIQNTCNFPVYISWNGYFNDVETQSIDYSIQLKRGTSSRPIFGPGDKIEAIPFSIATQKRFHAKIHSVCPTEVEATRLTGKRIAYVAQGARGMCIAKIIDQSGVRSAQ